MAGATWHSGGMERPAPVKFVDKVRPVSADESSDGRGGGVLAGLLSPLRLPERAMAALDSLAEAVRELAPMRAELTRVREQTEPLADLMPAVERILAQTRPVTDLLPVVERISEQAEPLAELLPALERLETAIGTQLESLVEVLGALESEESYLNKTVMELGRQLTELDKTIAALQGDVQSVTDHLPQRGPLAKARNALSGGGD